ncbi:unnamed protein product [Clonostachys rosea]|uniref:Peptidase M24 domain-containing protein n=1 Tax=Bionectria ochroleuca TaxID=29856 RepID=A0ABY6UXC8_BIOOC|nr:unnamed protein product [Clonostachys rosea]
MTNEALPTYSLAERDRRWSMAKSFMQEQGVDALIIFGEHEDAGPGQYAYDAWFTNDRPGATVMFPRNAVEPYALVPFVNFLTDHQESSQKGDAMWLSPPSLRIGRNAEALVELIRELQLEKSAIGVLGIEPAVPFHVEGTIPFLLWSKTTSQLPDATFKSVLRPFANAIMVQSAEELAVVRHAAAIGEEMAKAMVAAIRPGARENDVFGAGMGTAIAKGTVPSWMHLNSGPGSVVWGPPRWAWRPQPPRAIQNGDLVTAEIFTNFGMRQSQHQLTAAVGNVHEDLERCATIARACYDEALRVMGPNVRFGDVAEAMSKPVNEAGGWTKGPQLHGMNPLAPTLCGFTGPVAFFGDDTPYQKGRLGIPTMNAELILVPGMTFALEPSCGFGHQAVTIGGTVIITETGVDELNPFTAKLQRVAWE